jgi:hypothetical protein
VLSDAITDKSGQGAVMDWARILAYVAGTVDQELLARNEYPAAENLILRAQQHFEARCSRPIITGK